MTMSQIAEMQKHDTAQHSTDIDLKDQLQKQQAEILDLQYKVDQLNGELTQAIRLIKP